MKRRHTLQRGKVAVQTHRQTQPRTDSDMIMSIRVILVEPCQMLGILIESGSCAGYSYVDRRGGYRKDSAFTNTTSPDCLVLYLVRSGKFTCMIGTLCPPKLLSFLQRQYQINWPTSVDRTQAASRDTEQLKLVEVCQNSQRKTMKITPKTEINKSIMATHAFTHS